MMLLLALVVVLSAASTSVSGFNITRMLDHHSDLSNFNSLLTETGVADAINSRQTITVLVVGNSAISGLNGKGKDIVRNVIATHVVLDYYDMDKLREINNNGSALLTTLFQSTGLANGRQGFLNVTVDHKQIVFGSAVKDAQRDAHLVEVVASQPFNISVIQVSSIIVPPGIDQGNSAPPPRKMGPPPPADAPSEEDAPTPSPSPDSEAPDADADSPADDNSPADAPDSDAPSPASASGPAPGPADDDAADKKDDKKKSSGRRVASSGLLVAAAAVVGLVSTILAAL